MMVRRMLCLAGIFVPLTLAACVGQNEVLFFTNTNVGINLDSKPPTVGIAYDREEGYIGPSYDNGALAPVVARLQSNLNVFAPEIHQIYATGNAAKLLVDPNPSVGSDPPLRKNLKRVVYFATESSTGLRVSFASNVPDSVHFGYRRKEFSFIPIATAASGDCAEQAPQSGQATSNLTPVDCYASVLANIDLGGKVGDQQQTGIQVDQLFATGRTAEILAATNDSVRRLFAQKLGITQTIVGDGTCDTNCSAIQGFLTKNGEAGRTTVRTKCMAPVGVNDVTVFLFSTTYQAARQGCARLLSA
jgi:hypothetical protein